MPISLALNTSLLWVLAALILQINVKHSFTSKFKNPFFASQILAKITFQKMAAQELIVERNTLLCASALLFLASVTFCAFCDKFADISIGEGEKFL